MTFQADLTAAEAARVLRMRPEKMRDLIRAGAIPTGFKDGCRYKVNPRGLERWLEERGQK